MGIDPRKGKERTEKKPSSLFSAVVRRYRSLYRVAPAAKITVRKARETRKEKKFPQDNRTEAKNKVSKKKRGGILPVAPRKDRKSQNTHKEEDKKLLEYLSCCTKRGEWLVRFDLQRMCVEERKVRKAASVQLKQTKS